MEDFNRDVNDSWNEWLVGMTPEQAETAEHLFQIDRDDKRVSAFLALELGHKKAEDQELM